MPRLILIRHGESVGNTKGIFQGQTFDTGLTPLGKGQAKLLAKQLKDFRLDVVYASPLKRAFQTAEIIARKCGAPLLDDKRLIEINHGDWEGRRKAEVKKLYPEILKRWKKAPGKTRMPRGEHFVSVVKRVRNFLETLERKHKDDTVVVVAHDVILRTIIADVLGLPFDNIWRLRLDNGAINIVQLGKRKEVAALNNAHHLVGALSDINRQAL